MSAVIQDNNALYPALLSPYTLRGGRLRNRVVHASMTTRLAEHGRVTDRLIQYHINRARGSAALIVTEPLSMAPHQDIPAKVRVWNDENLDGLKRWAAAVESLDCRLLGQIQDPGRGRHLPGRNPHAVGASALADDISGTVPHVLSGAELERLVESFAQGAQRLQLCGFSGVELSCGHGHLFHQFLSPWSNVRSDAYGGDLAGRTRFIAQIVSAVRALCGRQFIVALKLPGNDGVAGGIGPVEAVRIAAHLTASGDVDFLSFAQGSHARSLEMHIPDSHGPRAPYLPLVRELRRGIPGVPVAALGYITDPAEADAIIASGDAELVALGRSLIADPAWLTKAAQGRAHDIRYCVSRNSCWSTGRPSACDNNPRVARSDEVDWWPAPAERKRRVVVVGAGVAGMEAAWIAAARGHQVTVFGRTGEVGGKARLRALLPGGETYRNPVDYQLGAARRAGVQFELGVSVTASDVIALRPDAVVLASGSNMVVPRWLPADAVTSGLVPDLRSALLPLLGRSNRQHGAAVIYDLDHTEGTYAAAEFLRTRFERVVVITPRDSLAQEAPVVTCQAILRRFGQQGIESLVLTDLKWNDSLEEAKLEYVHVYNGTTGVIEDVAFFAYSTPRTPEDALADPLRAAGIEVHVVGDCKYPRTMLDATAEGHAAGNAV